MRFRYGLILLLSLWLCACLRAQGGGLQPLRHQYETTSNDTVRLNVSKQLFGQYVYSQVDSAIYFARQVISLGEKLKSLKEILNGNNYLSIALSIKGDYEGAAVYGEKTLALHKAADDSLNMAYSYNNLGINYTYAGDYLKAVENLIASAIIKNALVDNGTPAADVDLASTSMNIGTAYLNQSDTAQAKNYYLQAIAEAGEVGNQRVAAQSRVSLGNIYVEQGQYSEALKQMLSAEPVLKAANDVFSLGKLYNNMTQAYAGLEQGAQVVKYAEMGIAQNQLIGNAQSEALGRVYLGLGYLKTGQYQKAITESNKALVYGQDNEAFDVQLGALKNLYEAYEALGNYKRAFEFSLKFKEVDELIFMEERSQQIERLSAQFEADKREMEIDKLNRETELKGLQIEKANAERNLLFLLFLSALIILVLIIFLYRKIVLTKRLLALKNQELTALNTTKDRFFAIIAHDLKGHIAAFEGTGRLLKHFSVKNDLDKIEKVTHEIDNNARNLSHLLDNLLHWSMEQLRGYEPKPVRLNLKVIIDELIEIFKPFARAKGIDLSSDLNGEVNVMADKESVALIFRNLIANAIKFTEQGEVCISAQESETRWQIIVRDTGVGIPEAMQEKLFVIGEEKIRRGTKNEKGTGLGLNLVYEFTKMNGGELSCESKEGQGTAFFISLNHA